MWNPDRAQSPTTGRRRDSARDPTLVAVLIVLAAAGLPVRGAVAAALEFTVQTVASQQSGDCKAIADFDGDGRLDVAVGGAVLAWYRSPAWTATAIRTADREFTTDMEAIDLDHDGDQDLVVPDGTVGVYWFENQNNGQTWVRHLIGSSLGYFTHDVAVGDIDGDGDYDVVSRPLNGALRVFRHDGAAWAALSMTTTAGEGLWLQDLDADGRLDIIVGGQWHGAPAGDILGGAWPIHVYDASARDQLVKVAVADLDGDGRPDIALTPAEGSGSIVWYRAPANPQTGTWVKTVLRAGADRYHSLVLADLDGNGWCDLITAQMHTAVTGPYIEVYLNPGPTAAWTRQVLANASSHNLVVGDLDGDGHLDLAGCNYIGNPPVRAWINQAGFVSAADSPARALSLSAAPNPFNAHVTLAFDGPGAAAASLRIYDLGGRLVRVLLSTGAVGASPSVAWDGRDADGASLPSGTYFAVLAAAGQKFIRPVMLLK